MGLDGDRVLPRRENDAAQPDLALVLHRARNDAISLGGDIPVGGDVIRLDEIDAIDLIGIDERLQVDGPRRFDLNRLEVVLVEQDILPFVDLIALDDVAALDLIAGFLIDQLDPEAIVRRLVELIEADTAPLPTSPGTTS